MTFKENYKLIDWSKDIVPERKTKLPPARSELPVPMIISDTIEPVQSMVDGSWHSSKSSLRATYHPSGNKHGERYIEVGNDPQRFKKKKPLQPDEKGIEVAVDKAVARVLSA